MELIDFNPLHQRWTYVEEDPHTGETVFREFFDKNHAIAVRDRAQSMKAEGLGRGENIRYSFSIDAFLREDIQQKFGFDPWNMDNRADTQRIMRTEYPHLLVNT